MQTMGREDRTSRPSPRHDDDIEFVPYALTPNVVAESLDSSLGTGLSDSEATARSASLGFNELPPARGEGLPRRILRQIREPMALLLIVASAASAFFLGDIAEAIAIIAIVVLNSIIAILQETKAEHALAALRTLESPIARVLRSSKVELIPARELVVGDVILLNEGDRVPADARLELAQQLRCDESTLTGESLPVEKDAAALLDVESPVADRVNMVFAGALVDHGSARAVVTGIGSNTEIGKIAAFLSTAKSPTPLQTELTVLTKRLGLIAILAAVAALGLILWRYGVGGDAFERGILAAVALAVAAVPEGLATVVTVALAMGVARMAANGAIVRRLPAVETLGATDVIATDKTGTLTRNEMTVVTAWVPDDGENARLTAALCSNAFLDPPSGDPLEVALLRWVGHATVESLRSAYVVESTQPFDSNRKSMSVIVSDGAQRIELMKGAPEVVLSLTEDGDSREAEVSEMAKRGLKVIALAVRSVHRGDRVEGGSPFSTAGVIGLGDPIRPETAATVEQAKRAGVALVMVTGDHPDTARAIAIEARMGHATVMTGRELAEKGPPSDPTTVEIYARVAPEQKLELVDALKRAGHVVAVTGDGVNDAPALHRADIGVAMGKSGTEVARQASDLVITDDNLATVVQAIREGRGIYDNIRKVVEYLVAANISEILVVLVALILFPQLGVPLLPLQLLWINLVTDGLPAIALGVDPVSPNLMDAPPRRGDDPLLSGARLRRLLGRGAALAAACLGAFAFAHYVWDEPWSHARMTMFATLALAQLAYAFAVRAPAGHPGGITGSISRALSNKWLLVGTGGGLFLQVAAMSWGPTRDLLGAAKLSLREWSLVGLAALLPSMLIMGVEGYRSRSVRP